MCNVIIWCLVLIRIFIADRWRPSKFLFYKGLVNQVHSPNWSITISAHLNHIWKMLHSRRNESTDFHCKSIDWFQYECKIDLIWVNGTTQASTTFLRFFLFSRNLSRVLFWESYRSLKTLTPRKICQNTFSDSYFPA